MAGTDPPHLFRRASEGCWSGGHLPERSPGSDRRARRRDVVVIEISAGEVEMAVGFETRVALINFPFLSLIGQDRPAVGVIPIVLRVVDDVGLAVVREVADRGDLIVHHRTQLNRRCEFPVAEIEVQPQRARSRGRCRRPRRHRSRQPRYFPMGNREGVVREELTGEVAVAPAVQDAAAKPVVLIRS